MTLKKEDIILVAQLLQTQKELAKKLDEEIEKKDFDKAEKIKNEILKIQKRISEIF